MVFSRIRENGWRSRCNDDRDGSSYRFNGEVGKLIRWSRGGRGTEGTEGNSIKSRGQPRLGQKWSVSGKGRAVSAGPD